MHKRNAIYYAAVFLCASLALSACNLFIKPFTVTYVGNGNSGGSVPSDSGNYASGDTVTVLGNTGSLTKNSSTFAGWNTLADYSGTFYAAGDTLSMGSADLTLYAEYQIDPSIFDFSAGNWVYSSHDQTGAYLSPGLSDTSRVSVTSAGVSSSGHDYWTASYRGGTDLFSSATFSVSDFKEIRVVWQALGTDSYYSSNNLFLIEFKDQGDANAGEWGEIHLADPFSTNHSFNGSVVIPANTNIYTIFTNNGDGTFDISAATGGFSDQSGSTLLESGVYDAPTWPGTSVRLDVRYGDTYDSNAGIMVTSVSVVGPAG